MRYLRSSLVAASIGSLLVGAQLVACGGDDDNAAPASIDAGTTDSGATGPVLTISDSRGKVYLGQTAKIDGASVAPNITANAKWVVVAAPSDSAIKSESLQGADSTSPSFKPDVLGQYTLQLSGDKDGVSSSVVVLIEAIDAPVFWREVNITGFTNESSGAFTAKASTHVGGAHGLQDRAIDCATSLLEDAGGESSTIAIIGARTASWGDTWEGPPGTPSRVAMPSIKIDAAATSVTFGLLVATSQSTCNSPDAKTLLTAASDAGAAPTDAIWSVRFSPDGNRLAFMSDSQGAGHIVTIGFDGSAKRDLGATQSVSDGGALNPDAGTDIRAVSGYPLGPITPHWKDSTHVGWVSFFAPEGDTPNMTAWNVYAVEDKDGAQPELVMQCTDAALQSFDFLPDGSIVAAVTHAVTTDAGEIETMDLVVYRANANKQCELVRNLTKSETSGVVRDLALSPDKTQIAFLGGVGTPPGLFDTGTMLTLSTVPVDGSSAPAQVPGAGTGAVPGVGPRWIAGGTALTWGHQDLSNLGGNSSPLNNYGKQVAIPAAGGARTVVTEGTAALSPDGGAVGARIISGVGQGCSVGRGAMSSGFMAGGVALGLASLIARRRRRSN